MSKISGTMVSLLAATSLIAGACGGSASASGSATVSEDGVSANASASASVPGAELSADASHSATYGGTTTAGGQQGAWAAAPTGACTEEWIHMPIIINFPTSGSQMDAQSRAVLDELVRSAQTRTDLRAVRVEGHTDRCGSEANNMVLSQQRAEMVAGELVALGVPRERVMTIGYGSQMPRANDACDRAHELSRATNRRVEFSLLVCR